MTIHTVTVIVRDWRRMVDTMNSRHMASVSAKQAMRAERVKGIADPLGNPARKPATNASAARPIEQATRKRLLAAPERTKAK